MSIWDKLLWMAIGFGLGVVVSNLEFAIRSLTRAVRGNRMYKYDPLRWLHIDPVKRQRIKDIGVWVCVLTAFAAAFVTGVNANTATESANHSDQVSDCTVTILGRLLEAQNLAREAGNPARVTEIKDKQKLVEVITRSLHKPPPSEKEARQIVQDWLNAVQADVDAAKEVGDTIDNYPLPTRKQLLDCVD